MPLARATLPTDGVEINGYRQRSWNVSTRFTQKGSPNGHAFTKQDGVIPQSQKVQLKD